MRHTKGVDTEVQWSQECDAWVGTFAERDHPSRNPGGAAQDGFEVEVLLRAEDWHVEVSHYASGGFQREHIQAADAEQAKARAADLLRAFRARAEKADGIAGDGR
jgi:hypothetical protein